jgi:hypothetical protein
MRVRDLISESLADGRDSGADGSARVSVSRVTTLVTKLRLVSAESSDTRLESRSGVSRARGVKNSLRSRAGLGGGLGGAARASGGAHTSKVWGRLGHHICAGDTHDSNAIYFKQDTTGRDDTRHIAKFAIHHATRAHLSRRLRGPLASTTGTGTGAPGSSMCSRLHLWPSTVDSPPPHERRRNVVVIVVVKGDGAPCEPRQTLGVTGRSTRRRSALRRARGTA